jgi:hypothetical protein
MMFNDDWIIKLPEDCIILEGILTFVFSGTITSIWSVVLLFSFLITSIPFLDSLITLEEKTVFTADILKVPLIISATSLPIVSALTTIISDFANSGYTITSTYE